MGRAMARALAALLAAIVVVGVPCASTPDGQGCDGCLKVRYWTVQPDVWKTERKDAADFPEAQVPGQLRPTSVGVAFSGGGTRSAAATVGQLRGLARNGWLDRVQYVTAVSGGSWTAVPFTFADQSFDLAQLLGRSGLDDRSLLSPNGLLAEAIVNSKLAAQGLVEAAHLRREAVLSARVNALIDFVRQRRTGAGMIGEDKTFARLLDRIFLRNVVPKGTSGRYFSWTYESNTSITGESQLGANQFVTAARRPFLIVGGSLIVTSPAYKYPALLPVEYTPLYSGVRQRFGHGIGGSYIRSWAYGSEPVASAGAEHVLVRPDDSRRFTLADVIASSGAAPQLSLVLGRGPDRVRAAMTRAAGFFPYWRPFTIRDGIPSSPAALIAHGDGGLTDNLGVMPLLARGVKNVLVFVNSSSNFPDNVQLQSYFMPVESRTGSGDKTLNKVFDERHWAWLMREFERQKAAGEALVACSDNTEERVWRVSGNEHYNIAPYPDLRICWVYNHDATRWRSTIPAIASQLWPAEPPPGGKKPRLSPLQKQFERFPWFSTFEENKPYVIKLSAAQVNVLADLAEWTITNPVSAARIQALFGGALTSRAK